MYSALSSLIIRIPNMPEILAMVLDASDSYVPSIQVDNTSSRCIR